MCPPGPVHGSEGTSTLSPLLPAELLVLQLLNRLGVGGKLFIDTHSSLLGPWASKAGTLVSQAARDSQGLVLSKGTFPQLLPPRMSGPGAVSVLKGLHARQRGWLGSGLWSWARGSQGSTHPLTCRPDSNPQNLQGGERWRVLRGQAHPKCKA